MLSSNIIDETLRNYVQRGDNLLDERDANNADMRELKKEVKEAGYSLKAFNIILRERRMDQDTLQALNETLEEYRLKLGMLSGTPLGDAAEAASNGRGRRRKPAADVSAATV